MDNQSPTEKAIAMAHYMEHLQEINNNLRKDLMFEREKHAQELKLQEAYIEGVKLTLNALLNRQVQL